MAAESNDNDISTWKKRCLQLEQQQDGLQADTELLGKVLQRLCVAAKGLDKDLDSRLDPLQEALKKQPADPVFRKHANAVEKGMLHFFQRRDEGGQRSLEALRKLVGQLGDLPHQDSLTAELDRLLEELPDVVDNYYEYPRILQETVRLQGSALDALEAGRGGSFGSGAADAPDANAGADGGTAGAESLDAEELQLICFRVGGLLMDLLGQLSIPTKTLPKARGLMTRIEAGFGWGDLESVLTATIEVTLKAAVTGHQEFENYLEGLNTQLLDIQSFLTESRGHQKEARTSSQRLDHAVRNDVAKVEESLSAAESLEQLKQSVRVQLADIVQAMDQYRREETHREKQMASRLVELQGKMESMEAQAVRVQAHLEEQRLRALSDPLTSLPNRAAYDDRVKMEHNRWVRYAGDLTLVVCDVDHFKKVNDNYGHLAGDKVLRLLGKILPAGIRETDFVARYGGEEFVVVMPQTDADRALLVMDKLREEVSKSPFNFKGERVQITMSFGIAEFGPSETPEQVFSRADDALYKAKQSGRNRCIKA